MVVGFGFGLVGGYVPRLCSERTRRSCRVRRPVFVGCPDGRSRSSKFYLAGCVVGFVEFALVRRLGVAVLAVVVGIGTKPEHGRCVVGRIVPWSSVTPAVALSPGFR